MSDDKPAVAQDAASPSLALDLASLTPARVALGRAGSGLPTRALLAFALDHARARDAVHARFDIDAVGASIAALGFEVLAMQSRAATRADYLRRPDLGRRLALVDAARLVTAPGGCDVALVIADGLSATAVHAHAASLLEALQPRLHAAGLSVGPVAVVGNGRVAIGDEIGAALGGRVVVVLIGERPGLSAPDSLGVYITLAPRIGCSDAARNCISNIRAAGLTPHEAAWKIAWLVQEALARGVSGVALKDESADDRPPRALPPAGDGC